MLVVKNPPANAGDSDSIHASGRPPRRGHGSPLFYTCLQNSVDRGAWRATVYKIARSRTQLKGLSIPEPLQQNCRDHMLQPLSPGALEPVLCNKRKHYREKPVHTATREDFHTNCNDHLIARSSYFNLLAFHVKLIKRSSLQFIRLSKYKAGNKTNFSSEHVDDIIFLCFPPHRKESREGIFHTGPTYLPSEEPHQDKILMQIKLGLSILSASSRGKVRLNQPPDWMQIMFFLSCTNVIKRKCCYSFNLRPSLSLKGRKHDYAHFPG